MNKELTDYHHKRNKAAVEAVKQMKKNPMSLSEFLEQVKRIESQRGFKKGW